MRATLSLLLLAALPLVAEEPRAAPLPRLAERLAEELLRAAPGRALQLDEPQSPGADPTAALDLLALLRARLEGRVALQREGARVRVEALLTRTEGQLVVSARLIEEPGARLLDIVSASVPADALLLPASPGPARPGAPLEVRSRTRSTPIEGPVLDLVLMEGERLLALTPAALQLLRWNGQELTLEARRPLPGPLVPVRHPGGLLVEAPRESSVWALTSAAAQAVLFEVQGARLTERARAAALPLKGAPQGLRYRASSDWLEGAPPGLGTGAFLALEPSLPELAVSTSGELLVAGTDGPRGSGLRAGPALAPGPGAWVLAISAEPPQGHDRMLLFERTSEGPRAGAALPLEFEGACTALATFVEAGRARAVVAVQAPGGSTHLELLELAQAGGDHDAP